ncbi:MAG TPA: ImcF-related family protein [Bryobacteraceae bacterium]|nr:ImcF-related family protein [Bryobacteraceae bacterium]
MKGFRIYWYGAASVLFFGAIGFLTTRFFNFHGAGFNFIMILAGTLGITAAAFFSFFQNKLQQKQQAKQQQAMYAAAYGYAPAAAAGAQQGGGSEIESLIKEADKRLAESRTTPGATISGLPVIFIIGDQGSAKTSVVAHCGLDPELLAGQVLVENNIISTPVANFWYGRDSVFVEAAGKLLAIPEAWTRLLKKLQPGKLKSVVGKGRQSPRAVFLCFDCESFTKPGASEQITATARYLQARLAEVSKNLGISFPVYVLFSKADRLAFFTEFVRNLSNEEAGQVFGMTLPIAPVRSGVYADEESRRLNAAFTDLFSSLCDRRIDYMPREQDPMSLPGAYEFPREFRKIRGTMVQFLVDLCRPSQLQVSPFLRGFYFSGIRPMVVNEASAKPAAAATPVGQKSFDAGATKMFRAGMEVPQAYAVQPQMSAAGRRVPQWMFLGHLFTDVILADHAAFAASESSVKTSLLRRILLGSLALLSLLLCLMFIISWSGNRKLENQALNAGKALQARGGSVGPIPTVDSLRQLDDLRQSLVTLTDYEKNGRPFSLGWGLYTGSDLYPQVRRSYYNFYKAYLFGNIQNGWVNYLQKVPNTPGPNDNYGYGYDTLKGYLLSTSEWKRISDPALQRFMSSLLASRWSAGHEGEISKDQMDLARAQFDFYSKDLQYGNPYSTDFDDPTVTHSRKYLAQFSGKERVYQALLSEAAKASRPINFNRDFPGSAEIIIDPREVQGPFTKTGWDAMKKLIGDAEKNFGGERWVLGDYAGNIQDFTALKKDLLDLYTADYIKNWREFVKAARFTGYSSLDDAAKKLTTIVNNQSPLMALMWVTSNNTNVDPKVAAAFTQPQKVVPPSDVQQYILPSNQTYIQGLSSLQVSIQNLPKPPDPPSAKATIDQAGNALVASRQITGPFAIDNDAHLEKDVTRLMEDPITHAEALLKGAGTANLNGAGRAFCQAFGIMVNKFPFNPKATDETTLQELSDIFRSKDGKLWMFYENTLKPNLTCSTAGCTPTGQVEMNPAFVTFFGQAVRFSKAVYGDAGSDPNYHYTLSPVKSDQVDSFGITVNGQTTLLKGGASKAYVWPGPPAQSFSLQLKVTGGTTFDVETWQGLWSVFHFFADADRTTQTGAGYTFVWIPRQGQRNTTLNIAGRALEYQFYVDTAGAPAVFSKDFLSSLKCVSTVAK